MERGNVLVIGNSGVGKSTLINAVVGKEVAKTGWGTSGTTDKLEIYEPTSDEVPFRVIDTIGFVPNLIKQQSAVHAVKKWSKDCAKKGLEDNQINVIWFCVDGTRSKLFEEDLKALSRAASMWESVPVVVVITKSYAVPDREKNKEMVYKAFAKQKKYASNLKDVIPVVAQIYTLNDTAYAPPEGITQLIDVTNGLMPEGKKAAEKDLAKFILNRKRFLAQTIAATSTAGAAVVGAVPIPFPDAVLLTPIEVGEVNAIARVYGIGKNEQSKQFLNSIVEVGTVGAAAKALISALKAIPGINLAASVINAVIAGVIVTALGEGSIYAFEQVYLGNKDISDIDWVKKIIEGKLSVTLVEKAKPILSTLTDASTKKEIIQVIMELAATVIGKMPEAGTKE